MSIYVDEKGKVDKSGENNTDLYSRTIKDIKDKILKNPKPLEPTIGKIDTRLVVAHRTQFEDIFLEEFEEDEEPKDASFLGLPSIKSFIDSIKPALLFLYKPIKALFKLALKPFKFMVNVLNKIKKKILEKIIKLFKKTKSLWKYATKAVTSTIKFLKNTAKATGKAIKNIVKSGIKSAKKAISKAKPVVRNLIKTKAPKQVKPIAKVAKPIVKESTKNAIKTAKTGSKAVKGIAGAVKSIGVVDAFVEGAFDIYEISSLEKSSNEAAKDLLDRKREEGLQGLDYLSPYRWGQQLGLATGLDEKIGNVIANVADFFIKKESEKEKAKLTSYNAYIKPEDVPQKLKEQLQFMYGEDNWFKAYHLNLWSKSEKGREKYEEVQKYLQSIRKNDIKDLIQKNSSVKSEPVKSLERTGVKPNNPQFTPFPLQNKQSTPINDYKQKVPVTLLTPNSNVLNSGIRV